MQPIVVLDTNVLISALLSLRGNPFRCLALAKTGVVQSVTCQEVLAEFTEKLCDKFGYAANRAQAASDEVRKCSSVVTITNALKVVAADPDDDKVLECAVVGSATHIVSGDKKHLLPLGAYQGIRIVSPAEFLQVLANASNPPSP